MRRVEARWGQAYATSWWVEYSHDLVTWTRVWPISVDAAGDQSAPVDFTARHVAVVAIAGVDPLRYHLASLEVYATP